MKRVIFLEDLKEADIRPEALYDKYRDILKREISSFFRDHSLFARTNCPGCEGNNFKTTFTKLTFQYCRCNDCGSLFVSPRPTSEMLRSFYRNSEAVQFWRTVVIEGTEDFRYRQFSFPMAQWILELVDEYLPESKIISDYGSKYMDFLNTINQAKKFDKIISINPEFLGREKAFPNYLVIYDDINMVKEKSHIFVAFEVLERIFSPSNFIKEVSEKSQKNGLLFLTTNTISGFEYQMLFDKSPRIHPPDRMNLLSLEAIQTILTKSGFEVIELSTPGRLDVEIVKNTLEREPDIALPEFFKYILQKRDERTWHSLQQFLQQNRLSSFVRIAARKK